MRKRKTYYCDKTSEPYLLPEVYYLSQNPVQAHKILNISQALGLTHSRLQGTSTVGFFIGHKQDSPTRIVLPRQT